MVLGSTGKPGHVKIIFSNRESVNLYWWFGSGRFSEVLKKGCSLAEASSVGGGARRRGTLKITETRKGVQPLRRFAEATETTPNVRELTSHILFSTWDFSNELSRSPIC